MRLIKASVGKSHRQSADDFKIGRTQVGSIIKPKFMDAYDSSMSDNRKRVCVRGQLE